MVPMVFKYPGSDVMSLLPVYSYEQPIKADPGFAWLSCQPADTSAGCSGSPGGTGEAERTADGGRRGGDVTSRCLLQQSIG